MIHTPLSDLFVVECAGSPSHLVWVESGDPRIASYYSTTQYSESLRVQGVVCEDSIVDAFIQYDGYLGARDRIRATRRLIAPGEYHPRIFRPTGWHTKAFFYNSDIDDRAPAIDDATRRALMSAVVPARALFERMRRIFEIIEPTTSQLAVYGHELRQLLILACTEVEAAFRAVLLANGYEFTNRPRTGDFIRLREPMRLGEWRVKLNFSADPIEFAPFVGWSDQNPTKSLHWYDAYNATKHDRETRLSASTLQQMLDAGSALQIMLFAQFGEHELLPFDSGLFSVTARPDWTPAEVYLPGYESSGGLQGPWVVRPLFAAARDDNG